MPKIGLRTLKTALAVFICLCLAPKDPFFAAITSIFCIQNTHDDSIQVALTRTLGTILGGVFGLIFLCLCRYIRTFSLPDPIIAVMVDITICVGIVLTIYCINLLKRPAWIPIGCVVFLAVTTANADKAPLYYTFVRCSETIGGMIIGLLVNRFVLPPKHYKQT